MQVQPSGQSTPVPPSPAVPLEEIREVLAQRTWTNAGGRDEFRETGAHVSFLPGPSSAWATASHHWQVIQKDGSEVGMFLPESTLPAAQGVTLGPKDKVVGQFQFSDDSYVLAEVPVSRSRGPLHAVSSLLRANGAIGQKVLVRLPERANSFDMGPDGSIAVTSDREVLRWTRKGGLEPWLKFDTEVHEVEYLHDGGLLIGVAGQAHSFETTRAYLAPGATTPVEVPFRDLFPDQYLHSLKVQVNGVKFLQHADIREHEAFLGACDWMKTGDDWKTHRAVAAPDDARVAVAVESHKQSWQLHLYDRTTAEARPLGPPSSSPPDQLQFSADGAYLVSSSMPKQAGGPVDLSVWDLGAGTFSLLPGVCEVRLGEADVSFRTGTGVEQRIPLADVPKAAEQPWFRPALVQHLLASDPETGAAGTIQQHEGHVQVGAIDLQVNQRDAGTA